MTEQHLRDVCASFQAACVDVITKKLRRALKQTHARSVIIGGGVMHQPSLLPHMREVCARTLHGYLPRLKTPHDFESYIIAPAFGDRAGVIGALRLAQEEYSRVSMRDEMSGEPATPES